MTVLLQADWQRRRRERTVAMKVLREHSYCCAEPKENQLAEF